jgi:type IV secretion system protein VirB11
VGWTNSEDLTVAVVASLRDEQGRRLAESMKRQLGEFYRYMIEPDVTEMCLNPDGRVWIDRLGKPMESVGAMRPEAAETFIGTVASIVRLVINYDHPHLQCRLPLDGSRFQATLPPISAGPIFSIRRHASAVPTLADYQNDNIISDLQRAAIEEAINERRNILIVGGTTSGKTTLLNSFLLFLKDTSDHRIVVCEDTPELKVTVPNAVSLWTNETTSMRQLVVIAMRLRPDRIIIGESRDGAILETLKAQGTGHPGGITTLHANNPRQALQRIEMLIREVSRDPLRDLIANSIDAIIHIERMTDRPYRRVTAVSKIIGHRNGEYELQPLA